MNCEAHLGLQLEVHFKVSSLQVFSSIFTLLMLGLQIVACLILNAVLF